MSIITEKGKAKKLVNNILEIAAEAGQKKEKNPSLINATIGMLYDEEGKLLEYQSVSAIIKKLSRMEKYAYANTAATPKFQEAIYRWLFKNHLQEIKGDFHLGCVPTTGGTGAISNTFSNYLDTGESVLIADIIWSPYKTIAKELNLNFKIYNYIKNNCFDQEAFLNAVNDLLKVQKRILFVLNDPCHNPTGFSLSKADYQFIIKTMNELSDRGVPFVLLYDVAYIDYAPDAFFGEREVFKLFAELKENAMLVIAFSGSKTYSVYGMRLGAQIALSRNKAEIDYFINANLYSSRTKWSNITKEGISLIEKLHEDENLLEAFSEEVDRNALMLEKRGTLFTRYLREFDIPFYPYHSGFFVTIKTKRPEKLFEELKEDDCYAIPLENGLRVSLSAVSLREIKDLALKLKKAMGMI